MPYSKGQRPNWIGVALLSALDALSALVRRPDPAAERFADTSSPVRLAIACSPALPRWLTQELRTGLVRCQRGLKALRWEDRRLLAFALFGLASLLEICGCNPARSGVPVADHRSEPPDWAMAMDQCPDCSSNYRKAGDRLQADARVTTGVFRAAKMDTAAFEREAPLFYDPSLQVFNEGAQEEPPGSSSVFLEDKQGPWSIPESVFFVYKTVVTPDGRTHRLPTATAFILSVPGLNQKGSVRFLVTARHVLDPEWAHCAEKNPPSIDVRLNRWIGGVGYETIPLRNSHARTFFAPSDETVDLAIVPIDEQLLPNVESYKFFDTPFRMLPTEVELRSMPPDQRIMTAGLVAENSPDRIRYPVLHGGVLSGNSTQKVMAQCGKTPGSTELHVWYINAAIPHGVSGAPVFASIKRGEHGNKTPMLLGVQAVAWPERGVAAMTPASELSDLVEKALRSSKRTMDLSKGPTP